MLDRYERAHVRMPWEYWPKKDVEACDKPRGAGKQALIRGFPNGETRRCSTASSAVSQRIQNVNLKNQNCGVASQRFYIIAAKRLINFEI